MSLVPPEILATIPGFYRTELTPVDAKVAHVKVFNPGGPGTWYICEFDPITRDCFGYVCLLENEWGCFSLTELEELRNQFGLPLERDLYWTPGPIPGL